MDEEEYIKAIKMIDRVYKELYRSDEIVGIKDQSNKYRNIKLFINKLDRIHKNLKKMPNYLEKIRNLLYDQYIIKPEEIPESYYRKLIKTDYENGIKKIILTEELRNYYQEKIIKDQKNSLDNWLNYFLSEETDTIPMWVKFWAFQGMLKLGTFNKETNTFNRRMKNNISNFADLNKEALKLTMIYIRKKVKKEIINDKELEIILKSGSFKRIYEYMLKEISNKQSKNKLYDGIWIKYPQGNNFMPLLNSLQGYNTEWCITGAATAYEQLKEGDFYIYYTKNINGEYKIPRLAIRMQGDAIIREICGVAHKQNIEEGFEDIIIDKIDNFNDCKTFNKGLNQLKLLTYIHKKSLNNEELSLNELIFIYEIKENIIGVVPNQDPRIKEIINTRDIKSDLARIFNCKESEIALSQEELLDNPNNIVCLYDNLTLYDKVNFPKLKFIHGNLECPYEKSANCFKCLERTVGNMIFDSLEDASSFTCLISIGKNAEFPLLKK